MTNSHFQVQIWEQIILTWPWSIQLYRKFYESYPKDKCQYEGPILFFTNSFTECLMPISYDFFKD